MASLATVLDIRLTPLNVSASWRLRWGTRQIVVCRDFRTRFYRVHPMIDCRPGVEPGHLEVLLFRKWLVSLAKAR